MGLGGMDSFLDLRGAMLHWQYAVHPHPTMKGTPDGEAAQYLVDHK